MSLQGFLLIDGKFVLLIVDVRQNGLCHLVIENTFPYNVILVQSHIFQRFITKAVRLTRQRVERICRFDRWTFFSRRNSIFFWNFYTLLLMSRFVDVHWIYSHLERRCRFSLLFASLLRFDPCFNSFIIWIRA